VSGTIVNCEKTAELIEIFGWALGYRRLMWATIKHVYWGPDVPTGRSTFRGNNNSAAPTSLVGFKRRGRRERRISAMS